MEEISLFIDRLLTITYQTMVARSGQTMDSLLQEQETDMA